jgi:hypothetical protein
MKSRSDETNAQEIRIKNRRRFRMKPQKELRMKHLVVAATATVAVWLATPASAGPLFFSDPPGRRLPTLSQPAGERFTFPHVTRHENTRGVFNKKRLL